MVLIITKVKNNEFALSSTFTCRTEAECQKIVAQEQDSSYDNTYYNIFKTDKKK